MANPVIDKIKIKRGEMLDLPVLEAGEFGLAQDEQRLFLGQQPIRGIVNFNSSDSTTAYVSFFIQKDGISIPLDLETVTTFYISINDSLFPASAVSIDDTVIQFAHGQGRELTPSDVVELKYNKEITSYRAETGTVRQAIAITKTLPFGTPQTTGITFVSDVKNSITLDYVLFDNNQDFYRSGKLNIFVVSDDNAKVHDEYICDDVLNDIEFSVTNNGTTYELLFDTAHSQQLEFNYTQTSNKLKVVS